MQFMVIDIVLFFIGSLVGFFYLLIISNIYSSWQKLEEGRIINEASTPNTSFSIIISARNEEDNIRTCLESIIQMDYPEELMDIIVVDDHSTDQTAQIASEFKEVSVLVNPKEGKKEAMKFGVDHAKNKYLWFVDGDSALHKDAARLADAHIHQHHASFIACPIVYPVGSGLLNAFQVIDSVVNMAVTAAGIHDQKFYLANGANMLIEKEAFLGIEGFKGNDHLASGDDVFLIQKMASNDPSRVHYIKSRRMAAVTKEETNWSAFWNQRKRWATKTNAYTHKGLFYLQVSIFMVHATIVALFALGFFIPISFFVGLLVLFIKGMVDYLFIQNMTSFFGVSKVNKWFIPSFFMYFPYIFFTAFHANFPSRYEWKGRQRK